MKLRVLQPSLAYGAALARLAAATKSNLPVLTHVRLVAGKEQLTFTGTDLNLAITYRVDALVDEEGAFTVPAKLFSDYVGDLPDDGIAVELDPARQVLHVGCGRFSADFKGIAASEYPALPDPTAMPTIASFSGAVLREAIAQVEFAAAGDNKERPMLAGVHLTLQPGEGVTLTATDGFRLCQRRIEVAVSTAADLLIPATALRELMRLIGSDEEVKLNWDAEKKLAAFVGSVELTTRLLDFTYPNVAGIIPHSATTKVELERGDFLKAIELAAPFARDDAKRVTVAVKGGSTAEAVVSASASVVGANSTPLPIKLAGEEVTTALNVAYTITALKAISGGAVELGLNGAKSPLVLRPVGQSDYLQILMPMTMQEAAKVVTVAEAAVAAAPPSEEAAEEGEEDGRVETETP